MQCLRNKILELEIYLSEMSSMPNFLCITEHWLKQDENVVIQGYKMVSCFTRAFHQHGGSSIYAKIDNKVCEVEKIVRKSVELSLECSCVRDQQRRILLICIYRSTKGEFQIFFNGINEILELSFKYFKNYKIILCGDFNINLLVNSVETRNFVDILATFGMNQKIFQATRETNTTCSLLDNIFTNFVTDDGLVLNTALSDHYGQYLSINLKRSPKSVQKVKLRLFTENKLQQLYDLLAEENWGYLYSCVNPNEAYNYFRHKLMKSVDLLVRYKTVQYHNYKTTGWITKGIRISCKKKRILYKQKIAGIVSTEYFNLYKSILKKVITAAKKLSNQIAISSSQNKTRASWKIVKRITGSETKKKDSLMDSFEGIFNNEKHLLDGFSKFFSESCQIASSNEFVDHGLIKNNTSSIFMYPSDAIEVQGWIRDLKNVKSVGEDEIPVCLLKKVSTLIANPLCHIANTMMLTGIYPENLKITLIKPIYKKGDRTNMNNYRPISLLSNIGKILEKIILNRMFAFFEKHHLLTEAQNGFRKGRSAMRAVYQLLSHIMDTLNTGQCTAAVCLDLSKAFDRVNHNILLSKMEKYGIRGIALNLIRSFLTDRKQHVIEFNKEGNLFKSDVTTTERGVPQGSILGPFLYIIYTNELPNMVNTKVTMYADDTSLALFGRDQNELNNEILINFNLLNEWFKDNELRLNIEKTQMVQFSYREQFEDKIALDCFSLQTGRQVKMLGIHIDSRLDWRCHVDSVAGSIGGCSYVVRVLSKLVNEATALSVYYGYGYSRMKYGVIFWGNSIEASRIFILQKKCIRSIFGLQRMTSCKPFFIKYNILTFPSIYILEAISFVLDNKDLFLDFRRSHQHNTRRKLNLRPPKINFSYLQKNVEYQIISIFNKIPLYNRINDSDKKLKQKMKKYLISKAYYAIEEFMKDEIHLAD